MHIDVYSIDIMCISYIKFKWTYIQVIKWKYIIMTSGSIVKSEHKNNFFHLYLLHANKNRQVTSKWVKI
jgi:hypothetical protein